ncbi:hypothetical protein ISF_06862 [Cordyceps fumosorosea ARSEF 2679]|uniref:Uncharacterized protein n=1 Tax=Cordyceps fumosorosea (strain ARSEF 2679) TaxID=1081104 RepID=A0A167R6S3_CORFA|nr:hypothetical protein ISF_06862 [Cordyceps fumosorosea ARSEF 2679]OAA58323.1 hypothetical protein ISF_06862 [Cordyceps fumosorosea ARSEF 2679]
MREIQPAQASTPRRSAALGLPGGNAPPLPCGSARLYDGNNNNSLPPYSQLDSSAPEVQELLPHLALENQSRRLTADEVTEWQLLVTRATNPPSQHAEEPQDRTTAIEISPSSSPSPPLPGGGESPWRRGLLALPRWHRGSRRRPAAVKAQNRNWANRLRDLAGAVRERVSRAVAFVLGRQQRKSPEERGRIRALEGYARPAQEGYEKMPDGYREGGQVKARRRARRALLGEEWPGFSCPANYAPPVHSKAPLDLGNFAADPKFQADDGAEYDCPTGYDCLADDEFSIYSESSDEQYWDIEETL